MKTVIITALGLIFSPVVLGCGPPSGTQPHAMSAAEHEAQGTQQQQASTTHGNQFDANGSTHKKSCSPVRGGQSVCWTSETNPTQQHSMEAKNHGELAALHRKASETLRSAEQSSCSSITEEDRDMSPFEHREDIRSVSPLQEDEEEVSDSGRSVSHRMAGAEVVFRAVPGMTAEWLQRVVDCHLARNAAIGHQAAGTEMPDCPLTPRGAEARVRSVGNGFAVAIRANDAETSKEILRRAHSIRTGPIASK